MFQRQGGAVAVDHDRVGGGARGRERGAAAVEGGHGADAEGLRLQGAPRGALRRRHVS